MALLENRVKKYNKKTRARNSSLVFPSYIIIGISTMAIICIISIFTYMPSFNSLNSRLVDFNGMFYTKVISPAQIIVRNVIHMIVNAVNFDRLHHENISLKLENQKLHNSVIASSIVNVENQKLKKINNIFSNEFDNIIKAAVVYESSAGNDNMAIISAGQNHGVRKNFLVMENGSLAGRIVTVGEKFSKVSLISSYNSRISVKTINTSIRAILVGNADKNGFLIHIHSGQRPQEGELLVTSGETSFYPKDIPVARVLSVEGSNVFVSFFSDLSSTDFVEVIDPSKF